MMKMIKTLLCMLLCFALMLPCAVAEDAYVPGEISNALIANAWNSGKLLNADVRFRMDLDGQTLGFSADEQQAIEAINSVLDAATLSLAAGKLEKGIRIEAGATLKSAQGGSDVTATAAANLDLYGVSLECSLLPGQKVTAKWETLMAMAGMSDSDITMVLSLRDIDWATVLPQVLSMIESYMNIAMQFVTPYVQAVTAWAETLTVEEFTNVAASDALPAAAKVTNLYLCEADVGSLINTLADTLEKDTTLTALADMLLAQAASELGETAPTVAQIISEMRSAAAGMTDTQSPIMFTLGVDEAGAPLYGEMYIMDGSTGAGVYGCLIGSEVEAVMTVVASLMNITAEGTVSDGFSMEMALTDTTANTFLQAFADGTPVFGVDHKLTLAQVTTAEGQPGFSAEQSMSMNVADGSEQVQAVMNNNSQYARTADGGETCDTTVAMDVYADGMNVTINAVGGMSIFPTADGFTGTYGLTESMPGMGINNIGFDAMLSTSSYDPATTAALAEMALETVSSEGMDSLMWLLSDMSRAKVTEIYNALPADVQALLQ